ncbi:hypothetical protein ABES25_05155 [Bacillus gobiensis]|uniref:hypothetical protein n=1 Tax=Bacillus gobiensis TaxID=1441095 RepID=UPI003D1B3C5F
MFKKRSGFNQLPLLLTTIAFIAAMSPEARKGAAKAYSWLEGKVNGLRTEADLKTVNISSTNPVHVSPEIMNVVNDEPILHMVDEIEESLH